MKRTACFSHWASFYSLIVERDRGGLLTVNETVRNTSWAYWFCKSFVFLSFWKIICRTPLLKLSLFNSSASGMEWWCYLKSTNGISFTTHISLCENGWEFVRNVTERRKNNGNAARRPILYLRLGCRSIMYWFIVTWQRCSYVLPVCLNCIGSNLLLLGAPSSLWL